jgi:transposase
VGLVLTYANTNMMALHLEEISLAIPPGHHALLVLDQAGWHTTKKLPRFPNVSLLLLPPGSPELNPAEQVWQQLRDRSLANRCYDSYEEIGRPAVRPGMPLLRSPAPSALCVPAAGRACRSILDRYESGLVLDLLFSKG